MTRLGVIARCDQGGLGAQTVAFTRQMNVDAALVVMLGEQARGVEDLSPFVGTPIVVNRGARLHDDALREFLPMVDVLYTIEGPYCPDLYEWCVNYDVRLVMHANPELWRGWKCHDLIVPTTWKADELGARVLPFPVNISTVRPVRRDAVPTFAHVLGPAMLDRQGTQLFEAALPLLRHDVNVVMRYDGVPDVRGAGRATVRWLPRTKRHADVIPDCWALVQPRRYGGLSLPVQEAAARGVPTIALDREPESTFYGDVTWRCPAEAAYPYPMAGGQIDVWDCDPVALANCIDRFIDERPVLHPRSWAESHSWEVLRPEYEALLR